MINPTAGFFSESLEVQISQLLAGLFSFGEAGLHFLFVLAFWVVVFLSVSTCRAKQDVRFETSGIPSTVVLAP